MNVKFVKLLFFLKICMLADSINKEPIIGILSQELSPPLKQHFPTLDSFIAASYVKAVESSGARVVPIVINKSMQYYRNMTKYVNGLVLPGGATFPGDGNPYYDSVKTVYKIAKELNENGTVFPILAVCLGFEFLLIVANNDNNFLKRCNVSHENYPIKFTNFTSALFSRLRADQEHTLQHVESTVNFHRWCAFSEDFDNSSLQDEWIITSTTTDKKNVNFIASVEHKKYPFFGIQFHPEKIAFEWSLVQNIPRSDPILQANRYFYDQLVYFAEKNSQTFPDKVEEQNSLIYNYFPFYSAIFSGYTQMYVF